MKATAQDIRLGAAYHFAARHGMDAAEVASLIQKRARLPERAAIQLAAHRLTTEPFRRDA